MPNRREPLNLMSFIGGLNLRRSQFELAEDESPDLLNVDIDPRGGFYTRKGWQRWNNAEIVDITTTPWHPVNAWSHVTADGSQFVYVVNGGVIYRADDTTVFAAVAGVAAGAIPHGADFTAWGDNVYLATGRFNASVRINPAGTVTTLAAATWSEIDAPTNNTMPHAEYVTTHAGYLFIACTNEADGNHFARIRWSHPLVPDAFRQDDFIDIDAGGGRITGIMGYDDHLLIFKTSTMWALYGSDETSWQIRQVSSKIGCPAITAMTRSETTAYFASSTDLGGMYAYQGQQPIYLSEALQPAFEEMLNFDHVFVSWCAQRLWVSVPWVKTIGPTSVPTSTFVFDPTIGRGAWTLYRCDSGALSLAIDNSDVGGRFPIAAFWSDHAAVMVLLEAINDAYDNILEATVLGTESSLPDNPDAPYIVTGNDEEILMLGITLGGQAFDSYYRTRWLHAGWPERKKSWRRPTFICREVPQATDLIVETYHDYDETNIHRSRTLNLRATGSAYWTEDGFDDASGAGFDWTEGGEADPSGRGADWGAQRSGSLLVRSGSMGLARAIQMRVRASPNTSHRKWGVDGIVAKFVMRRFQ
jgi:hypothetical protein